MTNDFFQILNQRISEGQIANPDTLFRRLDHPVCKECIEGYKKKFPDKPFGITCEGIYSDQDFEELYLKGAGTEDEMSLDEIMDIYDPVYWSNKHIRLQDRYGDLVAFEARSYQANVLRCSARRKVDRWGRGTGKALAIDTPIPTPSGWKTMGDLQPGDQVFDETGTPCTVTFVTDTMTGRPCYELFFSDGQTLVADKEHQWVTWTKLARKETARRESRKATRGETKFIRRPDSFPSVKTTQDILASLRVGQNEEVNHSIEVCQPLQYQEQNLPIAPYTLGVWLGDGDTDDAVVTNKDQAVLDGILADGYNYYQINENNQDITPRYRIGTAPSNRSAETGQYLSNGSLCSQLKALGVVGNKHIPQQYLIGSIPQRLALLQGLMDTDGNTNKGWAEFNNTNKSISLAVYDLAVGLGMKPSLTSKKATLNGRVVGDCYRVIFVPTLPVFRIPYKLAGCQGFKHQRESHRYIVDILPVPSLPVKCIQVDSPRRLYLAGKACIPTHNTQVGVIEEIHKAFTRKNHRIMIACPAKAQAETWYSEINECLNRNPDLADSVFDQKQAPYYIINFKNGSKITIFTTGSTSGKESDTLRGQSPRRIRIDEQDLLNPGDYKAIMPLLRRFPELEFHGSSTPTGKREHYWAMCTQYPDYKEFHYPISVHPDWNADMELACRREARTEIVYEHEFLAEFGDLESGVFKPRYVDAARKSYSYKNCVPTPGLHYFMGVDWNGKGTGTRIRIVAYNHVTKIRRIVYHEAIDSSTLESIQRIRTLNQQWKCEEIYIDHGFGHVQDELLRLIGKTSTDPQDRKLLDLKVIDFGASLTTNRLVPKRDNVKYSINPEDNELERRTKVFMVEGAVMAFEEGQVEFSDDDPLIEEQLRGYRVKTWSAHGFPNTYECKVGDHDLDALMLALLGIELKYGMFRQFAHVRSNSAGSIQVLTGVGGQQVASSIPRAETSQLIKEIEQLTSGISPRTPLASAQEQQARVHYSASYNQGHSAMAIVSMQKRGSGQNLNRGGLPSRTSMFTSSGSRVPPGGQRGHR